MPLISFYAFFNIFSVYPVKWGGGNFRWEIHAFKVGNSKKVLKNSSAFKAISIKGDIFLTDKAFVHYLTLRDNGREKAAELNDTHCWNCNPTFYCNLYGRTVQNVYKTTTLQIKTVFHSKWVNWSVWIHTLPNWKGRNRIWSVLCFNGMTMLMWRWSFHT